MTRHLGIKDIYYPIRFIFEMLKGHVVDDLAERARARGRWKSFGQVGEGIHHDGLPASTVSPRGTPASVTVTVWVPALGRTLVSDDLTQDEREGAFEAARKLAEAHFGVAK